MVSYFKTQWWRLLIALIHFVGACIYTFKPAPEVVSVEALDEVMSNMLLASIYFTCFIIWLFSSFILYNRDCIELLEYKAEKYDALCEEVGALYEANRLDRERMNLLDAKIAELKFDLMEVQK